MPIKDGFRSAAGRALIPKKGGWAGGRDNKSKDEFGCRIRRLCVCGFRVTNMHSVHNPGCVFCVPVASALSASRQTPPAEESSKSPHARAACGAPGLRDRDDGTKNAVEPIELIVRVAFGYQLRRRLRYRATPSFS